MYYLLDYKIPKYLEPISKELTTQYITEYASKFFKVTAAKHDKIYKAMCCLCYNIHYYLKYSVKEITVTLSEGSYSQPLIYNGIKVNRKVSYTFTRSILDWVHYSGLGHLVKGSVGEWEFCDGKFVPSKTEASKLLLSDYLIDKFKDLNDKPALTLPSVLEIRDGKGRLVTKELGEYQIWVINTLNQYNELARSVRVKVEDVEYDIQIKKIYNNSSFEQGGRNYMVGSRNMTREQRPLIEIDGESTVEIDFSALHPRIAATLEGVELSPDFDPYQIECEGYSKECLRVFGKMALLIVLNMGNQRPQATVKTIIRKLEEEDNFSQVFDTTHRPALIDYTMLYEKVLYRNDYLRLWFEEPRGLFVQNIDSKIMDLIIHEFNRMGELIIPVHDSIVIKKSLESVGRDVMRKAFKQVLGSDVNCLIK